MGEFRQGFGVDPRRRSRSSWPGSALSANQIEFIEIIVKQLTESGVMDPVWLYESPYADLNDQGLDGLVRRRGGGSAAGCAGRDQAPRGRIGGRSDGVPVSTWKRKGRGAEMGSFHRSF